MILTFKSPVLASSVVIGAWYPVSVCGADEIHLWPVQSEYISALPSHTHTLYCMWHVTMRTDPTMKRTVSDSKSENYCESIDFRFEKKRNDEHFLLSFETNICLWHTGEVRVSLLSDHENSQHSTLRWNGMESCLSCAAIQATALTVVECQLLYFIWRGTESLFSPRSGMCFSPDPSSLFPSCRSHRYFHCSTWCECGHWHPLTKTLLKTAH